MSAHVKFDEKTKVWSCCDSFSVPVHNPKISLAHVVLRSLETHGSKIAQVNRVKYEKEFINMFILVNVILDKR